MLSQQARLWLIDLEAFSQNFTLFFSTLQPDSQHRVKYQGRFRGVAFFCSSLNSLSQVVVVVVVVYIRTLQDLYVIFAALRKCPVGAISFDRRSFQSALIMLFKSKKEKNVIGRKGQIMLKCILESIENFRNV